MRRVLLQFEPAEHAPSPDEVWAAARAFDKGLVRSAVVPRAHAVDGRAYTTVTFDGAGDAQAAAKAFGADPHRLLRVSRDALHIRVKLVSATDVRQDKRPRLG
jgi:hypothetical protein